MVKYFRDFATELAEATVNYLANSRAEEISESYTPERISRLLGNIARNPQAPAGLQLALVDEPVEVQDQLGKMWAARASSKAVMESEPSMWERAASTLGNSRGDIYGALKATTRYAMPLADYGAQAVQGEFRNQVGQSPQDRSIGGIGPSFSDAFNLFFNRDELRDEIRDRFESPVDLESGQAPEIDSGRVYDMFMEGNAFNQTDLGQLTRELVSTGGIDAADHGNGFFISQESAHVARRRLAERVPGTLDDGQTITAGRWLGEQAGLDPESQAYNILSGTVDAGVTLFVPSFDNVFDPAIAAGGRRVYSGLGGSSAGDFLPSVGGYRGTYRQVDPQRARDFINGESGNRIVNWLAETDSWEQIYRRTNQQYPPSLVSRLADTADPDEVRALLLQGFEGGAYPTFRTAPGARWAQRSAGWRTAGTMPAWSIDFTDQRQAVNAIDDFAQNVNAPRDLRASWLETMGRAENISTRRTAYHQMLADTAEMLHRPVREGGYQLTPERSRQLTRYIADEVDTGRRALDDMIPWSVDEWSQLSDGVDSHTLPAVHLLAERAEVLPMPNARDLRRATGHYWALFETIDSPHLATRLANTFGQRAIGDPVQFASGVLGWMTSVWSASRLLRGAYTLRVVGEEQFRIGLAGYNSAFRHPISYISDLIGSRTGRNAGVEGAARLRHPISAAADAIDPNQFDDLTGQLLSGTTEFQAARVGSRPASYGYRGGAPNRTHKIVINRETAQRPAFVEAWTDELMTLATDPIAQRVARANNNDEVMMWLSGGGRSGTGGGTPAFRLDVGEASGFDKPQGLYVALDENFHLNADLLDDAATEGTSTVSRRFEVPEGAEVFDVSQATVPGRGARADGRRVGPSYQVEASAGVSYAVEAAGQRQVDEWLGMNFDDLVDEMSRVYPDVDWTRYFDNYEIIEGWAGLRAREDGHRILRLNDSIDSADMSFSEMVLLDGDVAPLRAEGSTYDDLVEVGGDLVGDGSRYRQELIDLNPEFLNSDRAVRFYLDSVSNRISSATGSNDDLLSVLRRGEWNESLDLDGLIDDFAPQKLSVEPALSDEQASGLSRAVDGAFEILATRPTNRFSRSPVFVQAYRASMVELAPLSNDTRALAEAAEATGLFRVGLRANMPEGARRFIPSFEGEDALGLIRKAAPEGRLSPSQIDELAKASALKTVQDLLYDVSRSSQFFDTYRLIFPFGEAWKEAIGTWARLIKESPTTSLRRAGEGHAAVNDSGIFHENANGQSVFTYPGAEQLGEAFTGVPFQMEGSVSGLNMMGEIYPGVGPVAAYPANWFLPKNSSWNGVRGAIMPFGEPGDPRDATEWILPSWARTMVSKSEPFTEEEQRLYGNTQFHVMRYLASTGEYDISSDEEISRLVEESKSVTSRLFLFRGLVQFGAPSSPQVVPQVLGPDGELAETQALLDRYYKLAEQDYDTALDKFIQEVGIDNVLLIGKNTQPTVHGGVPLNGDGYQWVQDNPEMRNLYPQLYGFFAPQTPGGDFNYDAYKLALSNGEIEQLDPKEKVALVNHRLAAQIYRRYRTSALQQAEAAGYSGIRPESAEFLEDIRLRLLEDYPGYQDADTIANLTPVLEVIDRGDVERVLADETLMATPTGEGLAEYWRQRQAVLDLAESADIDTTITGASGWRTSTAMVAHRLWLTNVGDTIAAGNPDFAVMWDQFLSREWNNDE